MYFVWDFWAVTRVKIARAYFWLYAEGSLLAISGIKAGLVARKAERHFSKKNY